MSRRRHYTPARYATERAANIRDLARIDAERGVDLDLATPAIRTMPPEPPVELTVRDKIMALVEYGLADDDDARGQLLDNGRDQR